MKLPFELLLLSSAQLALSATLRARSATFDNLVGLTTLTNDNSRKDAVQRPGKYFHEATFDPHYDGRFAGTGLPLEERTWHLRLLLRSYMETMDRIGVQTWIMHGCLLGWFWNGRIMPWDNDADVMVDERGMQELGNWWNMTVHHFTGVDLGLLDNEPDKSPDMDMDLVDDDEDMDREALLALEVAKLNCQTLRREVVKSGKKYLLEINPNSINTSTDDKYNLIDARWIDTQNGLYIDITALHSAPWTSPNPAYNGASAFDPDDMEPDDPPRQMFTKDNHAYTSTSLFPLRTSTFEGMTVKVPYDYTSILTEEYTARALTRTWISVVGKGYEFDEDQKQWVERAFSDSKEGKAAKATFHGQLGRYFKTQRERGRRKDRTVDDILEGREGEWIAEEDDWEKWEEGEKDKRGWYDYDEQV